MTTDPHKNDFDGCTRECRKAGAHTLSYGRCEHADKPEPTVSMSKVYTDTDGYPSIGYDQYTVTQLADLIEPAINEPEPGWANPYDAAYGRWRAEKAAQAIVHRNDEPAPAAVSVPPPAPRADDQAALDRVRALHQPIDGDGGPYCQTCTQDEEQPHPVGWWMPFPCPTVQVVDEELRRLADEVQQPGGPVAGEQQSECTASISGDCLREGHSETACDTEAGECVHGGQPAVEEAYPSHSSWLVELLMADGHWASAFHANDREAAIDRLRHRRKCAPHRKWRLVELRETYIVEETP